MRKECANLSDLERNNIRYVPCKCGKTYWVKDGPGTVRCGYCGAIYSEEEVTLCKISQPDNYSPDNAA
jgi:hypothetical protein